MGFVGTHSEEKTKLSIDPTSAKEMYLIVLFSLSRIAYSNREL